MRTHLEVRRTLATSRRREDLPVVFPTNDETKKLRVKLEKLVARNTKAAQLTSILPFNIKIQQAPLVAISECQSWQHTRVRPTFKTIQMPSMTRWTCFRSPLPLVVDDLQSHCQGQPKNGSVRQNWRPSSPEGNFPQCLCASSKEPVSTRLP